MLTADHRKQLADLLIDTPWCVYLDGLSAPVIDCPCMCRRGASCPARFTRETALEFAASVGHTVTSVCAVHGVRSGPLTPYVLHHGVVWAGRDGERSPA